MLKALLCKYDHVRFAKLFQMHVLNYSTTHCDQLSKRCQLADDHDANANHGTRSAGSLTMATLLRWCGNVRSLTLGMCIHDRCIKHEFESDSEVHGKLIQMYAGCGDINSAHALFLYKSHLRNEFIWNVIIRAYMHLGQYQTVMSNFHQMLCEGALPDSFTIVCIITVCSYQVSIFEGQRLHACMMASDLPLDQLAMNALLNMYSKCGSLEDVQMLSNNMPVRNAVAWTAIVDTFLQRGRKADAWQLFAHMKGEGVFPDRIFYLTIISVCSESESLFQGREIHISILEMGYKSDIFLRTALVNMYGNCGAFKDAYKVFMQPFEKNVVLWNSFISMFTLFGLDADALHHLNRMLQEGMLPDRVTFLHGLSASANNSNVVEGVKIHIFALKSIFALDIKIRTSIVHMYGRCGNLNAAWQAFYQLPEHNVISWNVMLGVLAQHGEFLEAFHLFGTMQNQGVLPDKVTFSHILEACESPPTFSEGEQLYAFAVELGLESDVVVGTALLSMYSRLSGIDDACRMFEEMPERNVVSWNTIIMAHMHRGKYKEVLRLFVLMIMNETSPDNSTLTSIIDACVSEVLLDQAVLMHVHAVECGYDRDVTLGLAIINLYGKLGSMEDAMWVFERLQDRSILTWTSVIAAHVSSRSYEQALVLYSKMEIDGMPAIKATYLVVLEACTNLFESARDSEIFLSISKKGLDLDAAVATALINSSGKSGGLRAVKKIFDCVAVKDVILWTAMIAKYAQNGYGKEAICLFRAMQDSGFEPNKVTLVNMLAACSHAGLVQEGLYFLASMIWDYGMLPRIDHFDCVIDLVGRAGLLDEAEHLINGMPSLPRIVSFMTLLNTCRCQGDVERGGRIARHVLDLNLYSSALYVMLANLRLTEGMDEQEDNFRV